MTVYGTLLLPVPPPTEQYHRTYLWAPARNQQKKGIKLVFSVKVLGLGLQLENSPHHNDIFTCSQEYSVQEAGFLSDVIQPHSVPFLMCLQTATECGLEIKTSCQWFHIPTVWSLTGMVSSDALPSTSLESSFSVTTWPAGQNLALELVGNLFLNHQQHTNHIVMHNIQQIHSHLFRLKLSFYMIII